MLYTKDRVSKVNGGTYSEDCEVDDECYKSFFKTWNMLEGTTYEYEAYAWTPSDNDNPTSGDGDWDIVAAPTYGGDFIDQHHARWLGNDVLMLFDNHVDSDPSTDSKGIEIELFGSPAPGD